MRQLPAVPLCASMSCSREGEGCKRIFSDICDLIDPCSLAATQGASRRWAAAAMRGALATEKVAFAQVLSHGGGDVHDLREGHFPSQGLLLHT